MPSRAGGPAGSSRRRRARTALATLAAAVLGVGLLAGCTPGTPGTASTGGPAVLRVGISADLTGLNPATTRTDRPIKPLAYESLIQLNSAGKYVPGLAASWSYFDGNKGFELKLRPDAKFSDGTPVDAKAVKAWIDYMGVAGGPYTGRLGKITSIEIVGDLTVRLHLAAPYPSVEGILATTPWGQIAAPSAVASPKTLNTETVGAGSYKLDAARSVSGDSYVFMPNEYYYDKAAVQWSEIDVKVISNPTSMLQAIQSGQLDVAVGNPSTAAAAKGSGIEVVTATSAVETLILDDLSKGSPTGDLRVRQAMNYAIDRKALAQALVGTYGAATSAMSPGNGQVPAYEDYYAFNPDKARTLLAQAGYGKGLTLKMLEPSWKSNLTQAVASQLAAVGITLNVTTAATPADYVTQIKSKSYAIVNQDLPTDADVWTVWTGTLQPKSLFNFTNWEVPELSSLINSAATSGEAHYWTDITKAVTEKAVFVPLYKVDAVYFVSKAVTGVKLSEASGGIPLISDWKPVK